MSEKGYFKVDRGLFDHWLWSEKPFSKGQAWVDLVGLANHKDTKRVKGGVVQVFKKGTVNRSMKELADRWGWNRKTVKRFLNDLAADRMLSVQSTRTGAQQGTRITIVNYGKYQSVGTRTWTQEGARTGHGWDTDGTQTNNDKNDKNEKNIYGTASREFPPSVDDVSSWVAEQGLNVSAEKFVAYYSARDWTLAKGRKMKTEADWHGALIAWREDENDGNDKDETRNPNQRDEYGAAEAEYFGTW